MSTIGSVELLLSMSTCDVIAQRVAEHLSHNGIGYSDVEQARGWLTTSEAADYLRLSKSELHRLAAAGDVPHEQDGGPGGRLFFSRDDLDGWRRAGGRRRPI